MYLRFRLLLTLNFICGMLLAQKVTIVDKITAQPISNVAIYSLKPAHSTITNARGQADISIFKNSDSIYFKHVSYKQRSLTYNEVADLKNFIDLEILNVSLDEVIISANRWEQQYREVPHRVEKMTQRDILFANPQTAADVLSAGGFAYVQKSQLAGGSPILRGFATNRVLLVVDGVRMNNAIFRTGNLQNVISIDALSIQNSEILFGPGAVIYGSDAIGGVMDFHTLEPIMAQNGKPIITGGAVTRFSSANEEKTGHINFNFGTSKWASRTSFSYSDFGDLKAGSNGNSYFLRPIYQQRINGKDSTLINPDPSKQVHSGYSQFNLMEKIKYKPSERMEFEYSLYYSKTSDAPRYDRLYLTDRDGHLVNAQWYYGPQKWVMNRLKFMYTDKTNFFDAFKVTAAHQLYEESRHDRKMNNARLRNQYEKVNAVSLNIDFDKTLSSNATLFYGFEGIHNTVNSTANRKDIKTGVTSPVNTRYPDGSTWQSYAFYGNLKLDLSSKWILNTGLRYSQIGLSASFDTTMFPFPFASAKLNHGALNGAVGLVYTPVKNIQLYTNLSTGFRSPNIDDLGKVFDSEPGTVVVPNDNLSSEYAYNAELGTAFTVKDFLKTNISIYYTLLDNALARRDFSYDGNDSIMYDGIMSKVQAIQNITQAYIFGTQIGIEFIPARNFRITSHLNYQVGEEQSEDSLKYYPLRHAVPLFGNSHIIYERQKLRLDLYADYNAGLSFDDLPLSERSDAAPYAKDENGMPFVPAWYTLNFKAAWYINQYLSVSGGIENITDQLYRPFAAGISAPGRNFIVSIKASF